MAQPVIGLFTVVVDFQITSFEDPVASTRVLFSPFTYSYTVRSKMIIVLQGMGFNGTCNGLVVV